MTLTDKELSVLEVARASAILAVEIGSMKQLNGTVKALSETGIDLRLIFMDEQEFNEAIK